jgi:hypothetical protein
MRGNNQTPVLLMTRIIRISRCHHVDKAQLHFALFTPHILQMMLHLFQIHYRHARAYPHLRRKRLHSTPSIFLYQLNQQPSSSLDVTEHTFHIPHLSLVPLPNPHTPLIQISPSRRRPEHALRRYTLLAQPSHQQNHGENE